MPSKSRTSRGGKKDAALGLEEEEFVMVPSASSSSGAGAAAKETAKESAEAYTLHMNCLGCKTLLTHPRSTLSLKCPKCKIIMDLPGAMLGADVVLGRIPSYANDPEFQQKLRVSEKAGALGVPLPPVAPPGHRLEPVRDAPKPPTFWTLLFKRAENRGALYQLLFTTALMVCVPLGLMGLTFWTIFAGMDESDRYMYSGFAGVVGVNIVAIGFGLFAYYDNSPDELDEAELTEAEREAEREAKRAKWEQWEKEQEATASREDRERLQAIREAHQTKQAVDAGDEDDDTTAGDATLKKRSKSSRSKSAARDSALGDEADPATEPEPSRTKRGRAKKA